MSIFEWLGESRNRGPVGEIGAGVPRPVVAPPWVICTRGLAGIALLTVAAYYAATAPERVLAFVLLGAYLIVSFLVDVRPDYSNIGFMGGLIDHPFRWSDDANRNLAGLRALLWPGRFSLASVLDLIQHLRGKRVIVIERTGE